MRNRIGSNASPWPERLIAWQHTHGRHDLPWQGVSGQANPYLIWISEIMLQQTQVGVVIPFYNRFIAAFPDVAALAGADEDAVLALWSGLGYYARARNLHACAKRIVSQYPDGFPQTAAQWAELPGVGRSTAAAIAAFAFGEQVAILDGNVKRVFARLYAIEGWPGKQSVLQQLWRLAEAQLPVGDIRAYTQGLMDLGALYCTRHRPRCNDCPLQSDCRAHALGREADLPDPRPGKTLPRREVVVLVVADRLGVLLEKRPPSGVWGGLYSLPELARDEDDGHWAKRHDVVLDFAVDGEIIEHVFTHFKLTIRPRHFQFDQPPAGRLADGDRLCHVGWSDLASTPLPAPIRKILKSAEGQYV